jgi:hypothetical protein
MELQVETFADELELPYMPDIEAVLRASAIAEAPHAEDAFLAEFSRWLTLRNKGVVARRAGIELAREALDLVGDAEGAWQALPVELWLHGTGAAWAMSSMRRAKLARHFVGWLLDSGRVSLHGQRLLARRIARASAQAASGGPSHSCAAKPMVAA